MINRDKLKPVIEKYKTYFPMHWRNSIDGGVSSKWEGLIVIRYYLALRGAENGVTAMVTPFFCAHG